MFRKVINEEITDEELFRYGTSHIDMCNAYLEEFVIPDFVAYYIACGYYHSSLWESSFRQHFNSGADVFNLTLSDPRKVMDETIKILKVKYSLKVVNENPVLQVMEI